MLGVGSVHVESDNNMASFRIRRVDLIVSHIVPIFDRYPLLTSKQYHYELFKQAALVHSNREIDKLEKHEKLRNIKLSNVNIPHHYISNA